MDINKVVNIILNGGVVVIPTDTVYGIVCDATNEEAVKKIYDIKGRDYSKPMIVLVSNTKMLKKYADKINKLEERLMEKFFPGEMTMILKKNSLISDTVTAGLDTVGIRIPNDYNLLSIISKINRPIVSTSANISNEEVITSIRLLDDSIINNVDYIYDGGRINKKASTIVKVENNKIYILRDGFLSDKIRTYIDELTK